MRKFLDRLFFVLWVMFLFWLGCIAIPIAGPIFKLVWVTGVWVIALPICLVIVYFVLRDEGD